jgi:hypothetical protein
VLAAEIDSNLVQVGVREDGEIGSSMRMHVRVLDGERNVVARVDDNLSARSRDSIQSDGSSVGERTVRYRRGWVLDAGRYGIHLALLDEIGGEVGATRVEVEVPEEDEGWRTSDLMLLSGASGLASYPIASDSFESGQEVTAYVEVKNGIQPVIGGRILMVGGRAVDPLVGGIDELLLPDTQMKKKRIDTHSGSIPLPTDLPPGRYILEIVVNDDPAEVERTLRISFEVRLSVAAG